MAAPTDLQARWNAYASTNGGSVAYALAAPPQADGFMIALAAAGFDGVTQIRMVTTAVTKDGVVPTAHTDSLAQLAAVGYQVIGTI